MKQFDIVLVSFPFSDLSHVKLRPAVIVASPQGNNLILCQITTKNRNIKQHEISLIRKYCSGDIRFDSYIYVDMIFTLHHNLVSRKLGSIQHLKTKQELHHKLRELFNVV